MTLKNRTPQQIARTVRYVLLVVTALCFVFFYLLDAQSASVMALESSGSWGTDVFLCWTFGVLLLILGCTFSNLFYGLKRRIGAPRSQVRSMMQRFTTGLYVGLVLTMILAYSFGSSDPVIISGVAYKNAHTVKWAGMMIDTSVLLMVAGIVCCFIQYLHLFPKKRGNGR